MTREERENVIRCLKAMIDEEVCEGCNLYGTTGTDHCEKDCVRMAIEALQTDPREDAISRQAAIHSMMELQKEDEEIYHASIPEGFDGDRAVEALNRLPSVNPQKVGTWTHDGSKWKNRWLCECGYKLFDEKTRFCPGCGRMMEK